MPGKDRVVGALTHAWLSALLLISTLPARAQTETVLYNFTGGSDGYKPLSSLTSHGGNFYGTTIFGGAGYVDAGLGTVFELSPNGSGGWNEKVLYDFCSQGGASCTDGAFPNGAVVFDSAGNLYGTASEGGSNCPVSTGCGVVFELSPGQPNWKETVLYTFCPGGNCQEGGSFPTNDLLIDSAGNLYGTDTSGVFELSPSGGEWTFQIISTNAVNTVSGLAMDANRNIFVVGPSGDTAQWTVYEISPNGKSWQTTPIYSFPSGTSGSSPLWSGPTLDASGNLLGEWTGWYEVYRHPVEFGGSVYKLSASSGEWTRKSISTFKGSASESEGNGPSGGVVLDAAGNVYGTTIQGGTYGQGTVFELLAPAGTTSYEEKVLWSFNGTDGANPYDSLILDSAGNLYGTTSAGGSKGSGVVFELMGVPPTTTTTLTSSPNPSISGQAVTFTASVTSIHGTPADGETVTFEEDTTVLGTGTLSGGSAKFSISALPIGSHPIKAVYGGDSTFVGSTSNTVKQTVKK